MRQRDQHHPVAYQTHQIGDGGSHACVASGECKGPANGENRPPTPRGRILKIFPILSNLGVTIQPFVSPLPLGEGPGVRASQGSTAVVKIFSPASSHPNLLQTPTESWSGDGTVDANPLHFLGDSYRQQVELALQIGQQELRTGAAGQVRVKCSRCGALAGA